MYVLVTDCCFTNSGVAVGSIASTKVICVRTRRVPRMKEKVRRGTIMAGWMKWLR